MRGRRPDSEAGGHHRTSKRSLRSDDRAGPASHIDLINAVALLMIGALVFFTSVAIVMGDAVETSGVQEDSMAVTISNRLADDLFVKSPTNSTISGECVVTYFQKGSSAEDYCQHDPDWADASLSDREYLNQTVGIQNLRSVNVSIWRGGSVVTGDDGGSDVKLALGPAISSRNAGRFERKLLIENLQGDGNTAWYTLRVSVW